MWLAALNKWRYGPRLAGADRAAVTLVQAHRGRRVGVCSRSCSSRTALLTALFAPEHLEGTFGPEHVREPEHSARAAERPDPVARRRRASGFLRRGACGLRADWPIIPRPHVWGSSSAGRAPRSQCGGRGFDPLLLHQSKQVVSPFRPVAPVPSRRLLDTPAAWWWEGARENSVSCSHATPSRAPHLQTGFISFHGAPILFIAAMPMFRDSVLDAGRRSVPQNPSGYASVMIALSVSPDGRELLYAAACARRRPTSRCSNSAAKRASTSAICANACLDRADFSFRVFYPAAGARRYVG